MENLIPRSEFRFARPTRQRGQALPEFIPLAIVLVPIFLLIPFLGKLADMNQTTIQAARYGAWERTVTTGFDKTDAQIQNEARVRFFGTNKVYIRTGDAPPNNAPDNQYSVLWRDQTGGRMLAKFTSVNASMANGNIPNVLLSAPTALMLRTLDLLQNQSRSDVPNNGFYNSVFSIDVAPNRLPGFDRGTNCAGAANSTSAFSCIRRNNVILADGWDSGTSAMVTSRVQRMLLTNIFAGPVSGLASVAGWVLPELREFKPGYVEPDVLPADRIGNTVTYAP